MRNAHSDASYEDMGEVADWMGMENRGGDLDSGGSGLAGKQPQQVFVLWQHLGLQQWHLDASMRVRARACQARLRGLTRGQRAGHAPNICFASRALFKLSFLPFLHALLFVAPLLRLS